MAGDIRGLTGLPNVAILRFQFRPPTRLVALTAVARSLVLIAPGRLALSSQERGTTLASSERGLSRTARKRSLGLTAEERDE